MSLSAFKNTGSRKLSEKDVDQAWKNESQKLKQEMSNVLKLKDPMFQVAKLMTMKDQLMG